MVAYGQLRAAMFEGAAAGGGPLQRLRYEARTRFVLFASASTGARLASTQPLYLGSLCSLPKQHRCGGHRVWRPSQSCVANQQSGLWGRQWGLIKLTISQYSPPLCASRRDRAVHLPYGASHYKNIPLAVHHASRRDGAIPHPRPPCRQGGCGGACGAPGRLAAGAP